MNFRFTILEVKNCVLQMVFLNVFFFFGFPIPEIHFAYETLHILEPSKTVGENLSILKNVKVQEEKM